MRLKPIYVGEYGFNFVFTATEPENGAGPTESLTTSAIDISSHEGLRVDFTDPSGNLAAYTQATLAAVELTTDGTDGKFQLPVPEDLFDEAGVWKMQGSVTLADRKWFSEVTRVHVFDTVA